MNFSAKEPSSPNQDADVIRLNNQSVEVHVHQETGRFMVRDLVAGVRWRMDPYVSESGRLVFSSPDGGGRDVHYLLGAKGRHGVRFQHKSSYVRSDIEDDYSSLILEGFLGDNKETQVEIEFLLSEAFPTLDLYLRINGKARDQLARISFPIGMAVTVEESGRLIVPQSSEFFLTEQPAKIAAEFPWFRPSCGRVSHGLSFFAMTKQSRSGREAACLGFLDCSHAEIDVRSDEALSVATPGTRNARAIFNNGGTDYRFRYRFVPDATHEAIAWLCREYVLQANGQ